MRTPARVRLSKRHSYFIVVRKKGYKPAYRVVSPRGYEGAYWANFALLTFFFLGMAVDSVSGCAKKLGPGVVRVTLGLQGRTEESVKPGRAIR